jgi:hypothetical protein
MFMKLIVKKITNFHPRSFCLALKLGMSFTFPMMIQCQGFSQKKPANLFIFQEKLTETRTSFTVRMH